MMRDITAKEIALMKGWKLLRVDAIEDKRILVPATTRTSHALRHTLRMS